MIEPTLQRIEVPEAEREQLAYRVAQTYQTPDGHEILHAATVKRVQRQIREGYWERLVWPPGATVDDAYAWFEFARRAVKLHKRGLV